ncbi:hypothetical protein E1B28_005389 [Marasmius oreades]|uniref:DUF6699 domain-containing protein n=1 Tax=Marasmius oreades TaxID=181124 RepID=A0A9P7UVM9_9AGAR|nr:uncharacterized protein E1B28_005389 [Marasmius oreades]KAG7094561.1 hypothetical protein E1B28_005389 [Marasmius oreades]
MVSRSHQSPLRTSIGNDSECDTTYPEYSLPHAPSELGASPRSRPPPNTLPSSPALLPFVVLPSMQQAALHGRQPRTRRCRPLPSQNMDGRRVVMHPKLTRRNDGTPPPPRFDLSYSFDGLKHIVDGDRCPAPEMAYLVEEATHPPLPSLALIHPLLPWCITAHASGINPRGVAVVDVLCAIYEVVQKELYLEGKIYPRLVFLKGRRILVGLKKSDVGGDVWEMIVE